MCIDGSAQDRRERGRRLGQPQLLPGITELGAQPLQARPREQPTLFDLRESVIRARGEKKVRALTLKGGPSASLAPEDPQSGR